MDFRAPTPSEPISVDASRHFLQSALFFVSVALRGAEIRPFLCFLEIAYKPMSQAVRYDAASGARWPRNAKAEEPASGGGPSRPPRLHGACGNACSKPGVAMWLTNPPAFHGVRPPASWPFHDMAPFLWPLWVAPRTQTAPASTPLAPGGPRQAVLYHCPTAPVGAQTCFDGRLLLADFGTGLHPRRFKTVNCLSAASRPLWGPALLPCAAQPVL